MSDAVAGPARPVHVLTTGGTIAMHGPRASIGAGPPTLPDDEAVVVEAVLDLPSAHLDLAGAHRIATRAVGLATAGTGVVVTHGTDTLEQTAYLTDLLLSASAPVVFTGSMRAADAPGADGPANLRDSITVARHRLGDDLGAVVVFGGEIHQARFVQKVDSVGPAAFASPLSGPLGYVREDRVVLTALPIRGKPLPVRELSGAVEIIACPLGSDGDLLRRAAEQADGLVVVLPGAGHVPLPFLDGLREVAASLPVVACAQPRRGALLRATYGFAGSEADVRAAGVVCAARLTPFAARLKLLAALGCGWDGARIAEAFAADDW